MYPRGPPKKAEDSPSPLLSPPHQLTPPPPKKKKRAWGELPAEGANRGEAYTLCMQRGPKRDIEEVKVTIEAGSAYVLMGAAQGNMRACKKHTTGHNRCNCCWTHGVRTAPTSTVTRHSMTLRVLADGDSDDDESDDDEEAASPAAASPAAAAAGGKE